MKKNKSIFPKEEKKLIRDLFKAHLIAAKQELITGKASMARIDYINSLANLLEK